MIIVGDAKTYDILLKIRDEYGHLLNWMIPFPGDWHILFNYQKVIMKIYADAGLTQLAKIAGHRSETLTSLLNARNFKRTHSFLLQCMEAVCRYMVRLYISSITIDEEKSCVLKDLSVKMSEVTKVSELQELCSIIQTVFSSNLMASIPDGFL